LIHTTMDFVLTLKDTVWFYLFFLTAQSHLIK